MKKIIYSPGEPAGIGPDLIIQLAASKAWENFKIPIITIGDPVLFIERAKKLKKKVKVLELDSLNNIQKNMTNDINSIISINALIRFRGGSLLSSKKLYIITLSDMANSV